MYSLSQVSVPGFLKSTQLKKQTFHQNVSKLKNLSMKIKMKCVKDIHMKYKKTQTS